MYNVNRHRLQGLLFAICLSLFPALISAQNAVLGAISSPDVRLSNHIRVSHTLGEPAVRRVDGHKVILSEGFQQGVWTIADDPTSSENGISVYPNPSGDYIHVAGHPNGKALASVILQNVQGIEIFRYPIHENGQTVNIAHLVPGTYRIQGIYTDGRPSSAIQLIKQ